MRILHLVGDRQDAGGVLSVIRSLQTASNGLGMQHVVWVNDEYVEARRPCLEYRFSKAVRAESPRHVDLVEAALPAYLELRRMLRAERFDILHAHQRGTLLVGLLAALLSRHPVVFTNHAFGRLKYLYRWSARSGMHTVLLTPNMAAHYGMRADAPGLHLISECFADSFLEEHVVERRPSAGNIQPLRFVGLGNMLAWKKWDLLLHAVDRLSAADRARIEVRVIGPTLDTQESRAFKAALESLISTYKLGERFVLMDATQEVVESLRAADWFVLPSTNEPCSVAILEALALGLPVLASASGGNVDIVAPGCGVLFGPTIPRIWPKRSGSPCRRRSRFALLERSAIPCATDVRLVSRWPIRTCTER